MRCGDQTGVRGFLLEYRSFCTIGIGANIAIFAVLNAAMFKSLPVVAPERLMQLNRGKEDVLAYPLWQQIRAQQDVFSNVLAYQGRLLGVADGGEKHLATGTFVSGSYFSARGGPAIIGPHTHRPG
jgi:hypothetical protein